MGISGLVLLSARSEMLLAVSKLSVQKSCEQRNRSLWCFIHQPMSRAGNDFPLHVRCNQLGLRNEEFAAGLLTAEHKHRHRERRRAQFCEVLCVALEAFEILEAGAHAARLRVSLCVKLAVSFRHGMVRVGSEVIPEVLEVSPLATFDQRQRHFSVKMEMPQVAHQPDILPIADTGKKCVHEHKALGLLWELRG